MSGSIASPATSRNWRVAGSSSNTPMLFDLRFPATTRTTGRPSSVNPSAAASPPCGTGSVSTVAETSADTPLDTDEGLPAAGVEALLSRGSEPGEQAVSDTAAQAVSTADGASDRPPHPHDRFGLPRLDM